MTDFIRAWVAGSIFFVGYWICRFAYWLSPDTIEGPTDVEITDVPLRSKHIAANRSRRQ